jgi:hypothetical protein
MTILLEILRLLLSNSILIGVAELLKIVLSFRERMVEKIDNWMVILSEVSLL